MKTAVFDIDETILVAKEWGDAVGANGEIPGALEFVKNLESDGYTIAYCTARPSEFTREVMAALADYGFPHTPDLVFLLPKDGDNVPRYKKNTIKMLMDKGYDVERFYDDVKVNRSVVSNLGVPVVEDLRETLKSRKNPKETLEFINHKTHAQLVRNMARVRRKVITADPSLPVMDMGKLETLGREAKFRWEICAASIAGGPENEELYYDYIFEEPGQTEFDSGFLVHDPTQPGVRKTKPRYFSAKASKIDKYGVKEKVYWPWQVNRGAIYQTSRNADKFPGWPNAAGSFMPYNDYSNGRGNSRYKSLTFEKKPGLLVALYDSPNQGPCAISFCSGGVNWTIGKNKKIGKNQLLKEIKVMNEIGLIAPWINDTFIELTNARGRKKTSSLGITWSEKSFVKLWDYSGAKDTQAYGSTNWQRTLYWRYEANGIRIEDNSDKPKSQTEWFEGVSQLALAIALGTGTGLTRRQTYNIDKVEIQNLILEYLAGEPADYDAAAEEWSDREDRGKKLQYDEKLARLTGEAPSLVSDLQPLIDTEEKIREEYEEADKEHREVRQAETQDYNNLYNEDERAARIIYEAEKKRAHNLKQSQTALANQKHKELTYADELVIRADAAKAVQAEIDAFKQEKEEARLEQIEANYQASLRAAQSSYEFDDDGSLLIGGDNVNDWLKVRRQIDRKDEFLADLLEFIDTNKGE